MPRNYASLSNCYKPLPFNLAQSQQASTTTTVSKKSKRDRASHELRVLRLELGITSATGSALVELGHTKVLCQVIGPTTTSTTTVNMEEGTLECQVQYVPNVGYPITSLVGAAASGLALSSETQQHAQQPTSGRINTQIGGVEKELANQVLSSLAAAVPLKAYPKNVIQLQLTILQDDGSVMSACTIAASLALVNASIEVYDMVTSATVAVMNDEDTTQPKLLADPTYSELEQADAVVTLSLLANWKEVTLWNQSGRLSSTLANEAISLCRDGCRSMHKFMRNALLDFEEPGGQKTTTQT
ncbi:complex component RRP41 [Seminavis robusta]|uniref:Complex component RRP41 n=1 Tax=Seminavis robusta TaxID=568900 RepID=A0A9N8DU48_9STRA|nr:complex component RRP41 [Seminavis robusta]|eukprot:Sro277_g106210.1 complex component RRP41 (300) ;mRNA; f:22925-23824